MTNKITHRTDYAKVRARTYPKIADQLDMLWHAMDNGELPKIQEFYDAIKAVKESAPKPTLSE